MDCRVRRATPYDIASMITIETASYPEPWGSDQFTGLLDDASTICLVAEERPTDVDGADRAITAYALGSVTMSRSQLLSIAVLPEHRGTHLATLLLTTLIAECRSRGATSMRLEVRANNRAARSLYVAFGFSTVALRPHYYGDDDALIMQIEF